MDVNLQANILNFVLSCRVPGHHMLFHGPSALTVLDKVYKLFNNGIVDLSKERDYKLQYPKLFIVNVTSPEMSLEYVSYILSLLDKNKKGQVFVADTDTIQLKELLHGAFWNRFPLRLLCS